MKVIVCLFLSVMQRCYFVVLDRLMYARLIDWLTLFCVGLITQLVHQLKMADDPLVSDGL